MRHLWTVIAEKAIVDVDSDELSLITVLRGIDLVAPKMPPGPVTLPIPIFIASAWYRTNVEQSEKGEMRLLYRSPSGELLTTITREVDLSGQNYFYTIGKFEGIPFNANGIYMLEIEMRRNEEEEWENVSTLPLELSMNLPEDFESLADEEPPLLDSNNSP